MSYLFYWSSQGFFWSNSAVSLSSFIRSSTGMCSVISPSSKTFGLLHQPTKAWGFIHLKKKYGKTKLRCRAKTCRHFRWYNAVLCFLQEFPFEFLLPCCCCWFIGPEELPCISPCDSHVAIWDFSLPNLTAQSCQPTWNHNLYVLELPRAVLQEDASIWLGISISCPFIVFPWSFGCLLKGTFLPLSEKSCFLCFLRSYSLKFLSLSFWTSNNLLASVMLRGTVLLWHKICVCKSLEDLFFIKGSL